MGDIHLTLKHLLAENAVLRQRVEALEAGTDEAICLRAVELETLVTIATTLASTKPFQEKIEDVLMAIKVLGDGDMAALRMPKKDESGLAALAYSGTGLIEDEPVPLLSYDQSISTLAYQIGETVVANDYAVHPRAVPSVVAKGVQAVIALPLKIGEQVFGIVSLTAAHKTTSRPSACGFSQPSPARWVSSLIMLASLMRHKSSRAI